MICTAALTRRLYCEIQRSLPLNDVLRLREFVFTNGRIGHAGYAPAGRSICVDDGSHRWGQRRKFFSADHDSRLKTYDFDVKPVVLSQLIQFADDLLQPSRHPGWAATDINAGDGSSFADD